MSEIPWLFAQQRVGIRPGLGRVRALLARLGNPQDAFKAILVTGTNGKGSTSSTLASILNSSGRTTGLFTSPHLSYFSERFVVNGQRLAAASVERALSQLKPDAIATEATFFEIVVALGCVLFAEAGVAIAVMECGMGGKNDATNVLDPELSLITNIALDHTTILGGTLVEIASDKAGIMRAGKPCLTTATGTGLEVLQQKAETVGARLRILSQTSTLADGYQVLKTGWDGLELRLGDVTLHTPLLGTFQAANVALAAAAAQELGVADAAIQAGVRNTVWAGRLERIRYQQHTFLLDGAHNPAAALALAQTLKDLPHGDVTLLFAAMRDKDSKGVLASLSAIAKRIIFTRSQLNPRAQDPQLLADIAAGEVIDALPEALARALAVTPEDGLILVAGSLYLVGEVRPMLLGATIEELERWQ